jgi:hypothetical protein
MWLSAIGVVAPADASAAAPALVAALEDARSDVPARHASLLANLQTRSFLETVDTRADYADAAAQGLHVGQLVDALALNAAPSAQRAFRALTTSKTFLADDERVIALIKAGVNVRPAPRELVRFWDRYSQPDDGFTPTTIGALVDNGSEPALRLLEQKLADPRHGADDKLGWMRTDMLRHRNDLPLLQASERLLKGRLPSRLRPALVEVLFDFRPGEWFKPDAGVSPPPLSAAPAPARAQLRKLGNLALRNVALNAGQKAAVERRLSELDGTSDPAHAGPE